MSESLHIVHCPLCFSEKASRFFYPPTKFNEKIFTYYTCQNCDASFIHPFPSKEDYDKIYGVSDHAYLKNLKQEEKYVHQLNLPLFNHQRYQLNFFKTGEYWKGRKTLLDIGCGSGFYMKNAENFGMTCTGIEYDQSFALLMSSKTDLNILSFQDFEKRNAEMKYDLIHFGHILEHLENPKEILDWAKRYAHKDTVIIVDGPLEKNPSLATLVIKAGSLLKKREMNFYPPQHLSFTNKKSQLAFFERSRLKTIKFKTAEQFFPLPDFADFSKPNRLLLFFLGHFSVVFSALIHGWGNVFHYSGKYEE